MGRGRDVREGRERGGERGEMGGEGVWGRSDREKGEDKVVKWGGRWLGRSSGKRSGVPGTPQWGDTYVEMRTENGTLPGTVARENGSGEKERRKKKRTEMKERKKRSSWQPKQ